MLVQIVTQTPAGLAKLGEPREMPAVPLAGEAIEVDGAQYVVQTRSFATSAQAPEGQPNFLVGLFVAPRGAVVAGPSAMDQAKAMGLKL